MIPLACTIIDKGVKIKPLFSLKNICKEFLMFGNLAVLLFTRWSQKENLSMSILLIIKNSEDKTVKKKWNSRFGEVCNRNFVQNRKHKSKNFRIPKILII